jgi:large subunit ribosomal protein L10
MRESNQPDENKIEKVKEFSELIKNKKTILIASIKGIPASQFQEISKRLRSKAIIKVPKKSLIFRALDSSEEDIKKLKLNIKEDVAILFSDLDCFDLALELIKNKTPAKARAGQESSKDIEVQAGPTSLVPGPAISELGSLGIQIQIEKGKINIKEPKIIVREGEKISSIAAEIMTKLEIKPFKIGFIPLCAFDNENKKLYLDIKIDKEGTIEEFRKIYSKSLPFAIEIGYVTEETIIFLLQKAEINAEALEKFNNESSEISSNEKNLEEEEKKDE